LGSQTCPFGILQEAWRIFCKNKQQFLEFRDVSARMIGWFSPAEKPMHHADFEIS